MRAEVARECSVEDCARPIKTRGMCGMHYVRWSKLRDPLATEGKRAAAREAARERYASDPERAAKQRAATRTWRAENPERARKSDLAASTKWRAEHPELAQEKNRTYYAKNAPRLIDESTEWRKANPDMAQQSQKRIQTATRTQAARNGMEWAGWEMELVSDRSRTSHQLALQLGRSFAAVSIMRHKISHDPHAIERAGLSESGRL